MTELRACHVEGWLTAKLSEASDNGRDGAVRAVRRLVRWAIRKGNKGTASPIESAAIGLVFIPVAAVPFWVIGGMIGYIVDRMRSAPKT